MRILVNCVDYKLLMSTGVQFHDGSGDSSGEYVSSKYKVSGRSVRMCERRRSDRGLSAHSLVAELTDMDNVIANTRMHTYYIYLQRRVQHTYVRQQRTTQ